MNKTTFYIVRHGETIGNTRKIIQGHSDTALTENGIKQAHTIREELSHINFAAVYSSDLDRAKSTAEIFLQGKDLALKTSPLLRERAFGKHEMNLYSEMQEEQKELTEKFNLLTKEERRIFKFADDIENDAELSERFKLFIKQTASEYLEKNVLVISHGGFMKAILLEFNYGDYSEILRGRFGNTGYIKLTSDKDGIQVEDIKGYKFE